MKAELDLKLLNWQQKVWTNNERFQVIAAGRRVGKTRYSASRMIVAALDGKPGEVWYIGLTQGNARDVMWNLLHELARPVIKSSHVNNLQITLINGSVISLKGSDRPDTMRGVSLKLAVLDEAAFMKPFVWEEIIRPALTDQKGKAVFIGTPCGRNWFYDLYTYAEKGDDPDWGAYHFTSYDNELLDHDEINAAKRSMSTAIFNQEYMSSFNSKESEHFKEEWLKFDEDEPETGDYYITVDLAGFRDANNKSHKRKDNSAIAIVKANEDGWWVREIKVGQWTFDETVRHIFHMVQKWKPISVGIEKGIAKQAVISPLMDMMKRHNLYFRIEDLTHGNVNKTARIIHSLQGRFEHGRITLNPGDWNMKFMDELFQFPSPLTHDDMIDALSYVDQLANVAYVGNFEEYDDFEALDSVAGY